MSDTSASDKSAGKSPASRPSAARQSAGILLYRLPAGSLANPGHTPGSSSTRSRGHEPEVFLVHPGGPFWKHKDAGSWTIPKGEFDVAEPALDAAIREFREETGATLSGNFIPLTPIRQKGGKRVFAWAIAGNFDPGSLVSNSFEIEWPRGSGKLRSFPEVDKGAWYALTVAREYINSAQIAFLDELSANVLK